MTIQERIKRLEAKIQKLEADLEELRSLKKENEILRFNIKSPLRYIEETRKKQLLQITKVLVCSRNLYSNLILLIYQSDSGNDKTSNRRDSEEVPSRELKERHLTSSQSLQYPDEEEISDRELKLTFTSSNT